MKIVNNKSNKQESSAEIKHLSRGEKYEKFKKYAKLRVRNAVKSLRILGNLSNKSHYYYEEKDIRKIFNMVQNSLSKSKKKFTYGKREGIDDVDELFD